MNRRFVPSKTLRLMLVTGVGIGIEGQLVSPQGFQMSDDEVILHLGKLGFVLNHPARDVELIREAARVKADMDLLRWERLYLEGAIDDTCPSPLSFVRTLGALSDSQKLEKINWYQGYLVMAATGLDGAGPDYAETLRLSRFYRKHWQKFLKTKQK